MDESTTLYPAATAEDVEFYNSEGYLIVRGAINVSDLEVLEAACDRILEKRHKVAFDWAWEEGVSKENRLFHIVQASPSGLDPDLLVDNPYRHWMVKFASKLMGEQVEFWYDQFLAKPPEISEPTFWHQDEGYWGRNLDEKGITCWLPLHDVDTRRGCMHFIARGHRDGVLTHQRVAGLQSDLLRCEVDESRVVACPIELGDVTFHHSKTPHMTPRNETDQWRRILTNHFKVSGTGGEGDHYPWKVCVNQFTGELTDPNE